MNNIERKVFNGLIGASMVGGALAGCVPIKTSDTNPNTEVEKNSPQIQALTQEVIDELEGSTKEQDLFFAPEPYLRTDLFESESWMEGTVVKMPSEKMNEEIVTETTDEEITQIATEKEEERFDWAMRGASILMMLAGGFALLIFTDKKRKSHNGHLVLPVEKTIK